MSLRRTIFTLIAVLAGALAPTASADTLFTSIDRTTPVALGTTASVFSPTFSATVTAGGTPMSNACTSSTLTFAVGENGGAGFAGTFTSGTFSGCNQPVVGTFPWRFTVRGTGATSGGNTVFTTSTWEDVAMTIQGVPFGGDFTDASGSPPDNGVYVKQTTSTGTGICFVLANVPTPVLTGTLNGTFCLEGTPSTTWTIGSTLTPPPLTRSYLRADPAGNTLTGASTLAYAGSDPTTLTSTSGSVTCASTTVDALVGPSGGTGVLGVLNALTLASCTDTLPGVTVTTCARTSTPSTTLTFNADTATGGTQILRNLVVKCSISGGGTFGCYYGGAAFAGTVTNTPNATTYNNVPVLHTVPAGVTDDLGAGICGNGGTFSAKLTGLTQVTTGTALTLRQS